MYWNKCVSRSNSAQDGHTQVAFMFVYVVMGWTYTYYSYNISNASLNPITHERGGGNFTHTFFNICYGLKANAKRLFTFPVHLLTKELTILFRIF